MNRIIAKKRNDKVFNLITNILLILSFLVVALPLWYIIVNSFSSPGKVVSGEVMLWPKEFTFEGYIACFQDSKILSGYKNTLIYTFFGTIINVVFTVLAAYPLSRPEMPGRNIFAFLFTFTMIFNGGLIPTYLLNMQIGILNTPLVMMLPNAIVVWNLMLAKNFFEQSIPTGLIEAAKIDGCNDFQVLLKMILPLAKPILAVLVLFYAVGHWNAYFDAFIYLNDEALMPLQVVLRDILISNQVDPGAIAGDIGGVKEGMDQLLKYSTIIVACLPIWCVYPFIQKFFVKGVLVGSIKG